MDTRRHDREIIEKGLKSKDPNDRRQAKIANERINAESKGTREMRNELVEAHKYGNKGKIEELHHRMKGEGGHVKKQIERYFSGRRGL